MFTETQPAVKPKRRRKNKLAEPTGAEILEKAAREARPNTPGERRKIERAGQESFASFREWPVRCAVSSVAE